MEWNGMVYNGWKVRAKKDKQKIILCKVVFWIFKSYVYHTLELSSLPTIFDTCQYASFEVCDIRWSQYLHSFKLNWHWFFIFNASKNIVTVFVYGYRISMCPRVLAPVCVRVCLLPFNSWFYFYHFVQIHSFLGLFFFAQ